MSLARRRTAARAAGISLALSAIMCLLPFDLHKKQQHSAHAFQPASLFHSQQPNKRSTLSRPGSASSSSRPVAMRYQSPWDLAANSENRQRLQDGGGRSGVAGSAGATVFSLPGLLQECPLQIEDPDVREGDTSYTLTFNLPTGVKEDGLDVSVSGRLLTIDARVTREDNGGSNGGAGDDAPPGGHGGWVTRSSRTHSASRSFVLPVGVSNQVTAFWVSDGQVEIKLDKVPPGAEETADILIVRNDNGDGGPAAMEDSGGVPVEAKEEPLIPSSAAEEYLSGLKGRLGSVGVRSSSSDSSADSKASAASTSHQHHRHRSLLAALDDEFRDLAKAMWDDAVKFPSEEQVAATVAKAREERARRVTAMRRTTMATDVSEKKLSYIVRVALPKGATRDNVKLTVTPDKALRVAFSAKGHPSVSKDVRLPWDALFSEIAAKFKAEKDKKRRE